MNRGFFGIGCFNMKNELNYGTLFRSAAILGADFMFIIGRRFKIQSSDTVKSWKHIPLYHYADFTDFNSHRPKDSILVGVEFTSKARRIETYDHPERAVYLLGAEDTGLPDYVLSNCQSVVVLPGEISMNVAVAGSIVMYDRVMKYKGSK